MRPSQRNTLRVVCMLLIAALSGCGKDNSGEIKELSAALDKTRHTNKQQIEQLAKANSDFKTRLAKVERSVVDANAAVSVSRNEASRNKQLIKELSDKVAFLESELAKRNKASDVTQSNNSRFPSDSEALARKLFLVRLSAIPGSGRWSGDMIAMAKKQYMPTMRLRAKLALRAFEILKSKEPPEVTKASEAYVIEQVMSGQWVTNKSDARWEGGAEDIATLAATRGKQDIERGNALRKW